MKFTLTHDNEKYLCEWFDANSFEEVEDLHSCSGFIFNDKGELLIIRVNEKQGWCIPGGRIEDFDKSAVDALIREVYEESNVILKEIKPLGYFRSFLEGDEKNKRSAGRFIGFIQELHELTEDPAEGVIPERKFIPVEEFEKYVAWGENGVFQLKKALEKVNQKLNK